ncbi:MAG: acylphosphatase [Bacteroidetes bacterium]|nr:acylphosphatase [Bacteroidota bacterium]
MIRHYNITIKGKVQGVNYRANAQAMAHKLDLTGYVKNLPKSGVYAEVEGKEEKINQFIEWCNTGPQLAKVTEVKAEESDVQGFQTFEIKR